MPDNPSNNKVEFNYGNYTINGKTIASEDNSSYSYYGSYSYVYGGYSSDNEVTNNIMNINYGDFANDIHGGYSDKGNTTGNIVNIYIGNFYNSVSVYGGRSHDGDAINNILNINHVVNKAIGANFYGGYSSGGNSINNTVSITVPYTVNPIMEGRAYDDVYGGYSDDGDAINNTVNIDGGSFGNVYSGYSSSGTAKGNILNINNGSFPSGSVSVYCAYGHNATDNKLTINGGNFYGYIVGSQTYNDATNNIVNINGGAFYGYVEGSSSYFGNVKNNTINIYNKPNLTSAILYGGYAPNGTSSGNTLNIHTKGLTAKNIGYFQNMNFYIPVGTVNGETMLTLTTGTTDLSGVAIRAGVDANNTTLNSGDTVILLTSANGLITDETTTYGKLTEGVSLTYDLTVTQSGNSIIATIGGTNPTPTQNVTPTPTQDVTPTPIQNVTPTPIQNIIPVTIPTTTPLTLNPQIDVIDKSAISPMNTVLTVVQNDVFPSYIIGEVDFEEVDTSTPTSGTENDAEDDTKEIADVPNPEPKGWEIFGDIGGGSLRTKTGNGSHVNTKTTNLDLGIARNIPHGGAGKLTVAPIIDYARGSYDSYLSDGTHGTGNTKYLAGGFMGRNTWNNGFYLEGSFRIGKVKTDFASNDLDTTGRYGRITYDTSAKTLAGHLKVGKNLRLNKNNILDVYAAYYHAHQGSMDANLYPSGDRYRISSADGGRFKLGYRLTTRTSKISRIYTGLAYQYEYANGITSTYLSKNISTSGGNEKGSSGMLELGWLIKPLKNNPWAVDINTTGWIGHQRGVTAMAKVVKAF